MSAMGAGISPAQFGGNELLPLLLLLMVLSPGLFSGENSLLLFILIIMLASGGGRI